MTTTTTQQRIPAATYSVDPVHSHVGFAVTHNGVATFRGAFDRYAARLVGGGEARLEGSVEVGSIDVDDEQLKGHLLSPEFFDAGRHPRIGFASTEVRVGEDGDVAVRGTLEIGGRRQELEASGRFASLGEDAQGRARAGLSLSTAVDRRDYGLDWQAELPGGGLVLEFEVRIEVELELVEEAA